MIISKTPFRLSLFGGGTDYPAWFINNPSEVLTASMARYSYITVRETPIFSEYNYLVNYSEIEKTMDVDSIRHPSVKNCLKRFRQSNVQIVYDGDLPARSGIGSSSTFTVGLLNALNFYNNISLSKKELAQLAINIEQNDMNESVGIQDQIAASYGGILNIKMGPGNKWNVNKIKLSADYILELEKYILLGYSNISRFSETQAKKKIENIKNKKTEIELKTISDITKEAIYTLYEEKDIKYIGSLLNKSWEVKKKLAEGVTTEWLDTLYNIGLKHGAFGGKVMGAGGGGFFYFLAPPNNHNEIKKALNNIKFWTPFKFDFEGSKIILNR